MAIPASRIVSVMPRVIAGGSSNLELNGLLLVKNDMISADTLALSFTSAKAVGEYFGTDSLEYETASTYFTSYDNKFAAPTALNIALRVDEDCAAWIRSAAVTSALAELKAVTDGVLTLTVDGSAVSASGVDFSEATSFSDCADKLGEALGLDCSYSSLTKAFTVKSSTTGEDSTVDFATPSEEEEVTDLAVLLGFTESAGAVLSQGVNAMTEAGQLEAILKKTQNWFSFTTAWEPSDEEALAYSQWASNNFGWLYVPYTYAATAVSQDSGADIGSQIKDGKYDHVAVVYGSLAYAAFLMGAVASIPWNRVDGTITLAFKSQSGLAALVTDETEASVLESKNVNYYGIWATRNADFAFLYNGTLACSDYGYIDAYANAVWLTNRIQVSVMDGLKASPRTPYTDRGYAMIRAWMMDPINEGLYNGAIEAGVQLSESQKSEVYTEVGQDVSNELWTQGYYLRIVDPGASVRAQRGTPEISLHYCYSGSVHKIEIAATALL